MRLLLEDFIFPIHSESRTDCRRFMNLCKKLQDRTYLKRVMDRIFSPSDIL